MKYKCIIFDMDGLMFDTETVGNIMYDKASRKFNYPVPEELLLRMLGGTEPDNQKLILETFGENYPIDKINQLYKAYMQEYMKNNGVPVKTGLVELLKYLKEQNIPVAVASSSPYSVIEYYLDDAKVSKYIDYIISGDRVEKGKPDPEIFLNVCQHYQIKTTEALVLEDSKNGIMAAVNGNIPVICVPDIVNHPKNIYDLTYRVVQTLHDVITVLKED